MDITGWRKRIEELDRKLVELLNERSRCAAEIGRLKHHDSIPLYQPLREREILDRVQQLNSGPLSNAALRRLFERILDEVRAVEQEACGEEET